jgi:cation diffusion facilitator CzcD-associated flavoprotein CzcO
LLFVLSEYDWRLFGTSAFSARERRKVTRFFSFFPLLKKVTLELIERTRQYEAKLIEHMHKTAPEKYHAILTPNYEVACKRRVFDAAWLPALNDPRIELTTQPVTGIQAHSVTLGPGSVYPPAEPRKPNTNATSSPPAPERHIPVDVIILAHGFAVHRWLHPLDVRGRGGRRLHDVWAARGGPQAYLGAAVDGFPNFFIVWGPNTVTGHSSSLLAVENVVELVLRFVAPVVLDGAVATVEVKREAELAWARDMQAASRRRVFSSGGCRSWYVDEKGWNSVTYP